jgi:hypothetical protein
VEVSFSGEFEQREAGAEFDGADHPLALGELIHPHAIWWLVLLSLYNYTV